MSTKTDFVIEQIEKLLDEYEDTVIQTTLDKYSAETPLDYITRDGIVEKRDAVMTFVKTLLLENAKNDQ